MRPAKVAIFVMFLVFSFSLSARAEIVEKPIEYSAAGLDMKGMLYFSSENLGKTPGVLVVHEWWGLNDYAKRRARMLAELGYTAFAVDMYGSGKNSGHPDDAKAFSSEALKNFSFAKARFEKALEVLKDQASVDKDKIAAIGYCFGGGVVLNMARSGVDLKGVVSFHGSLTPAVVAKPGEIKAKMLVLHGASDDFVPESTVAAFKKEMDEIGASYLFKSYPNSKHAFTNTDADRVAREFGLDIAYNEEADEASWKAMREFFDSIF